MDDGRDLVKRSKENDSSNLVERARAGDRQAFAALYETVYQDLYHFALYILKDIYDAQDVVAETVADAYEGIRKLRDKDAFRSWIFKILTNKCKRKLKEYAGRTTVLIADMKEAVPESCDGTMLRDVMVREAFFALSDEERLIVSMQVFGGYKSEEIGKILHTNHNTVRSKLSRALKKMETSLS